MKSTVFALVAPLLAATVPAPATYEGDASIILGKFFPGVEVTKAFYAAWPSQSDPCSSQYVETIPSLALPNEWNPCGVPFTVQSTNSSFTNVEAENCQFGPGNTTIEPVKPGASPSQRCIAVGPSNKTCSPLGYIYEADALCGGPLTDGNAAEEKRSLADCDGLSCTVSPQPCLVSPCSPNFKKKEKKIY